MESNVDIVLVMNVNCIINSAVHADSFISSKAGYGDNIEDSSGIVVDAITGKMEATEVGS